MRIAILLAAALGLASCTGDPKICTRIIEPRVPDADESPSAMRTFILATAEACVHKTAYRLASSPEDADTVVRAVLAECDSALDSGVGERRQTISDAFEGRATHDQMVEVAEDSARRDYAELALTKVVEGRAGGCKP